MCCIRPSVQKRSFTIWDVIVLALSQEMYHVSAVFFGQIPTNITGKYPPLRYGKMYLVYCYNITMLVWDECMVPSYLLRCCCWFSVHSIKIKLLYDSILLETTKCLQYFRHHADYKTIIRYIIGLVEHVQFDGFTMVNFITYFSWFTHFDKHSRTRGRRNSIVT